MIVLSAKDITKAYGTDVILDGLSFHVNEGDRVGIIGANGAGKTTMLKILTGELPYDSGDFFVSKEISVGYLKQNDNFKSENTVIEEVSSIFAGMEKMEQEMLELSAKVSELSQSGKAEDAEEADILLHRYDRMQEDYKARGGYSYKSEINGILKSMAFGEEFYNKKIGTLSGGERTRLALACLLLEKPEILFLDEPTNHLDIGTLKWLEQYLKSYTGTIMIVSHDRYFLDQIATRIFEIENHKLYTYEGGYSQYAQKKKQRREAELRSYNKQQTEIKRQEDIIRRFKQRGTEKLAKRAQSREKRLGAMDVVQRPDGERHKMKIMFRENFQSGRDVLIGEGLSKGFGYGQNRRELFRDAEFDIKRGERICIVGPNGIGKTTLLKILVDELEPDGGYLKIGHNVDFGYYDQTQERLSGSKTLLEELQDSYRLYSDTELRSILGRFLFTNDTVFLPIDALSGGEKARLALVKLMLSGANVLVMDEPTNHLDIESKEVFEEALLDFPGTVIVVSHDRYFLNRIPTRIFELGRDGITPYLGAYDYYVEKKQQIESGKAYLNRMSGAGKGGSGSKGGSGAKTDAGSRAAMGSGADGGKGGAGSGSGGIGSAGNAEAGQNGNRGKTDGTSGGQISSEAGGIGNVGQIGNAEAGQGGQKMMSAEEERRAKKEAEARQRRFERKKNKLEAEIAELEDRCSDLEEQMCLPQNLTDHGKLAGLNEQLDSAKKELDSKYEQWIELQE